MAMSRLDTLCTWPTNLKILFKSLTLIDTDHMNVVYAIIFLHTYYIYSYIYM